MQPKLCYVTRMEVYLKEVILLFWFQQWSCYLNKNYCHNRNDGLMLHL